MYLTGITTLPSLVHTNCAARQSLLFSDQCTQLYKIHKAKIYMYQYFKRQLKTPTCFGPSGIHPQGVLKVLH